MRAGVTNMSARLEQFHYIALWGCAVIGIIVIGAMFYTMFAHQRSLHQAQASATNSTLIEFIWALIPVLILVGMVIPAMAETIF